MSLSMKEHFRKNPMSVETRKKISLTHVGIPKPPFTEEHKRNISIAGKIPRPWCRGEKSNFWKGGRTDLVHRIKQSINYRTWRENVFKRDNWSCRYCGTKAIKLYPHHIIPLSEILTKNNIKVIEEAYVCSFLWDINNGITLCHECHKKTDTYGKNINQKLI